MTIRYVGPGGNNGNSGLSWALRKLTLNGVEDTPVVAGDVVYVGPGVYREMLTCDVSGANTYSTGTVSVTKASDQVTGSGTAWLANVVANYLFHVRYYAYGTDGVTNGDNTFSSAAGNFQADMVNRVIQINTKNSYGIATVVDSDNITLTDVNGVGWPTAGSGLTYSVMSGEGHYEIESVDADGTLTLVQPWQGRTLTGLAYLTFNPICYIADVTGQNTDGIGGIVRVTGSNNDQTIIRSSAIYANTKSYRLFRGFRFDSGEYQIYLVGCTHFIIEDCWGDSVYGQHVLVDGAAQAAVTIRRSYFQSGRFSLQFAHSVTVNDSGHVIENCIILPTQQGISITRVGGITIKNVSVPQGTVVAVGTALTVGQTAHLTNSVCPNASAGYAVSATTLGELVEDYNSFSLGSARLNVAIGANSNTYLPQHAFSLFYAGHAQLSGFRFMPLLGELSPWSQHKLAGVDERNVDLFGIPRPVTAAKNSWGATQFVDMALESTTVQAGLRARQLKDAGSLMVRRVPCTAVSTTVTLYVRRETNYAGSVPRMVIKQPGQADRTTDMTAAVDTWEQLSDTFTPAALPGYFEVWCQSRNTAVAGDYKVFYDTFAVS